MSEKWALVPDHYKLVADWFKPFDNRNSIFEVMAKVHLDHRSTYDYESLIEAGINREFMIQHWTDPKGDSAVVYGTIFTNTAIEYGFPANVAILEIARTNGLELPVEITQALDAMKVAKEKS